MVRGYKLELLSIPVQTTQPVAMESKKDQDLTGIEVQKMLDKGAVKIVNSFPNQYLSRIFLVPKKDSSFRPVINLRRKLLNQFIAKAHFKMENLAMIRDLLREGDWMASIDLKDTYLSVAIWEEYWKYLSFCGRAPCMSFSATHLD